MRDLRYRGHGPIALSALDGDIDGTLTRRKVLAGTAAAAAAAVTIDAPAGAVGADPNSSQDMVAFLLLSSALAGIAPSKLAPEFQPASANVDILNSDPGLDPINIKRQYFDLAYSADAATFEALLQIAKDHRNSARDIIAAVSANSNTLYLGRSLVLLWYLGAWYQPRDLADAQSKAQANPPSSSFVSSTVASATAYTQGWIWQVAQAHPMGYSELQFGYWSRRPADLNDTKHPPLSFITDDFRST